MSKLKKKIILIGNYPPDRQESMKKFANMLHQGFTSKDFDVEIWNPVTFFGYGSDPSASSFQKWLGYIDKWMVFPIVLMVRMFINRLKGRRLYFHICDHSNAPYFTILPSGFTSITCHDVLAIRGAFGFTDAYCNSSFTGKLLQKWILNSLIKFKRIACVSELTQDQLNQLIGYKSKNIQELVVIHNAFNHNFRKLDGYVTRDLLKKIGLDPDESFILHVGSSLERKNRHMLLKMAEELGSKWNGKICFAGQPLNSSMREYSESAGLSKRIISIKKPDHASLVALYNACEAFIFPSFSEGFGWPVIEAQACGAPVIASKIEPMPEIGGTAAIYADPNNPSEFAEAFLTLQNNKIRSELIRSGFENIGRFNADTMIDAYLDLFGMYQTAINGYAYAS
ncbi:MAG: glycosyltransferase family 4 protein [Flavisolibacter sp.]